MIKILSPTNNPDEVESLIKAGANELYCGVLSDNWKKLYTNVGSINRREFNTSNLKSFDQLKKVVRTSHSYDVPVFITMNAFYSKKQMPIVLSEAKEALCCDVDGFIIADINLLAQIRVIDNNISIHASTGATILNKSSIEFYKKLGVGRVVLPRHLTINEIKGLSSVTGIEKEIFIMNTRCMNIDGFCTFQHGINEISHPKIGPLLKKAHFDSMLSSLIQSYPKVSYSIIKRGLLGSTSACCLDYDVKLIEEAGLPISKSEIESTIKKQIGPNQLANHCGACALYDFISMNIDSVKIVGRQNPVKKKLNDILFLKEMLCFLNRKESSKEQFANKCKESYNTIYKHNCNLMCYY